MDYHELIQDLRYCASSEVACDNCKHKAESWCTEDLIRQAADAIEELSRTHSRILEALEREREYLLENKMYGAEHILVHHAIRVIEELR